MKHFCMLVVVSLALLLTIGEGFPSGQGHREHHKGNETDGGHHNKTGGEGGQHNGTGTESGHHGKAHSKR